MVRKQIGNFSSLLNKSKKVAVDTNVFIYQFSDHRRYSKLTNILFKLAEEKKLLLVTSIITPIEVMSKPESENRADLVSEYQKVFEQMPNLKVVPVDWQVAKLASRLRGSNKSLKIPDAIQVASGLLMDCSLFITNDNHFKNIGELKIVLLSEYS